MMDDSKGLVLEPWFHETPDGTFLDVVVKVDLQAPGFAVVQTAVHKQQVLTDAKIPTGHQLSTLFRMQKRVVNNQV